MILIMLVCVQMVSETNQIIWYVTQNLNGDKYPWQKIHLLTLDQHPVIQRTCWGHNVGYLHVSDSGIFYVFMKHVYFHIFPQTYMLVPFLIKEKKCASQTYDSPELMTKMF